MFVTHGHCNARPTVTFLSAGHHRPLTGTKLYCLVTEARVCEQLAQGCYLKVEWPGVKPVTTLLHRTRCSSSSSRLKGDTVLALHCVCSTPADGSPPLLRSGTRQPRPRLLVGSRVLQRFQVAVHRRHHHYQRVFVGATERRCHVRRRGPTSQPCAGHPSQPQCAGDGQRHHTQRSARRDQLYRGSHVDDRQQLHRSQLQR